MDRLPTRCPAAFRRAALRSGPTGGLGDGLPVTRLAGSDGMPRTGPQGAGKRLRPSGRRGRGSGQGRALVAAGWPGSDTGQPSPRG